MEKLPNDSGLFFLRKYWINHFLIGRLFLPLQRVLLPVMLNSRFLIITRLLEVFLFPIRRQKRANRFVCVAVDFSLLAWLAEIGANKQVDWFFGEHAYSAIIYTRLSHCIAFTHNWISISIVFVDPTLFVHFCVCMRERRFETQKTIKCFALIVAKLPTLYYAICSNL